MVGGALGSGMVVVGAAVVGVTDGAGSDPTTMGSGTGPRSAFIASSTTTSTTAADAAAMNARATALRARSEPTPQIVADAPIEKMSVP